MDWSIDAIMASSTSYILLKSMNDAIKAKVGKEAPHEDTLHMTLFNGFRSLITRPSDAVLELLCDWMRALDLKALFPDIYGQYLRCLKSSAFWISPEGPGNLLSRSSIKVHASENKTLLCLNFDDIDESKRALRGVCLRCDPVSLVNIAVNGLITPDLNRKSYTLTDVGDEAVALWTIIDGSCRQVLKTFLKNRYRREEPLVNGREWLTDADIQMLTSRYKHMKIDRIEQKVGQLVYIPAGCIYQCMYFCPTVSIESYFVHPLDVPEIFSIDSMNWKTDYRTRLWRKEFDWLSPEMIAWDAWLSAFKKDEEADEQDEDESYDSDDTF